MDIFYPILANITIGLHLLYVFFVIIGELLIIIGGIVGWQWIKNFWFRMLHLFAIFIVAILTLLNRTCPLTTLEYQFRKLAGQKSDQINFIPRLMRNILFWDLPEYTFSWLYIGFAVLVIGTLLLFPPLFPRENQSD